MTSRSAATGLLWLSLLGILPGCAAEPTAGVPPVEERPDPILLLVSIDGFRHDYLERYRPPNLQRLARQGVRAGGLVPVFPSKTFPNHYTLVTGLWPEHHGIVTNTFYDPEWDEWFSRSRGSGLTDGKWWGGQPIWVAAARQGVKSATCFWPGSEAEIDGARPSYWRAYDTRMPGAQRVDQVLEWLDLPDAERPRFITLYFGQLDHTGHRTGPDSTETAKTVQRVDRYLGQLLQGLEERDLLGRVDLIVVSDHGMTAASPDRVIYLEDYIDLRRVLVVRGTPLAMLFPRGDDEDVLYAALRDAHPHLSVYRRDETPQAWHYRSNRRIAPLIAVADEGWHVSDRRSEDGFDFGGGAHGYDPGLRSMHGLFVAHGPAFKRGVTVPEVHAIDLYALMTEILGLQPAPHDGDLENLRPLLR